MIIKGNIELVKIPKKVHCVVTSPPYYKLRRYSNEPDEIGWESTPQQYVDRLADVFSRISASMEPSGTLFINVGDKYLNGSMACVPQRFTLAMLERGFLLKNNIVWHKRRIMPQSAKNRFTYAHEAILFFVMQQTHLFNYEPVMEDSLWGPKGKNDRRSNKGVHRYAELRESKGQGHTAPVVIRDKRLCRDVWDFTTTNSRSRKHSATFPESIPERCILAGSDVGDTVLDPFSGSGTVGKVAHSLGRKFIGIDILPVASEPSKRKA